VFTARQSILESSAGPSPYLPTLEATVEFAKECNTMVWTLRMMIPSGNTHMPFLTAPIDSRDVAEGYI
jgi:hypothetical protein